MSDHLSIKAISNAVKKKGLQKTKFYCQMCQKQCLNANGFKNHCETEGHLRMMQVFQQNPEKILDDFSKAFDAGMYDIIKRNFRNKRVHGNTVYMEYIKDKEHIHLNSTRWSSVSAYCRYLGQSGKCKIEEDPKGYFLTYIEQDPEVLEREKKHKQIEKAELNEEERLIKQMAKHSSSLQTTTAPTIATQDVKVGFSLIKSKKKKENEKLSEENEKFSKENEKPFEENEKFSEESLYEPVVEPEKRPSAQNDENDLLELHFSGPKKKSKKAWEHLKEEQEIKKERKNRSDYWLCEGIVVKVINKDLMDGKYYNLKGVIKKVFEKNIGLIHMLDSKDVLKLDQTQLQTVIPALGKKVAIVNGAYRGAIGTLLAIDQDEFKASVQVDSGHYLGNVVSISFDDISKIHE